MSTCPNCGAKITCGCQRRTATNGAAACTSCLGALNAKIKAASAPKKFTPPAPPTAPTNVTVTYKPPTQ